MPSIEDILLLIALGFVIGAYSISIGAGGGFLIAPLLLIRHPDAEPELITAASLTAVLITSVASSVITIPERRVDIPVALAMASLAIPAGLLGALGTVALPRQVFALGFALLLVSLAVYIVRYPTAKAPPDQPSGWARRLVDRDGHTFRYHVPLLRSVGPLAGMASLSALAGIGGGPIGVPIMTRVMRIPHAIAVPTIQLNTALYSAAVVALHVALGHAGEPLEDIPFLGAGVLLANPVGQRLRRRLGEGPLMRALAMGLLLVAARTAWGALR
jgi:hypothetical protein